MDAQKVTNLVLLCLGLFTAGVSLTLLVPFYPSEALAKVRSHDKHYNITQSMAFLTSFRPLVPFPIVVI